MDHQDNNFQAKKSLGQNFLHAPHIIGKMVHAAGIIANKSVVLEVGPGKGVLTRGLLDARAYVIAIEKDDRAIPFLQEKFALEIQSGQLTLIHGDILEFNPTSAHLPCKKYTIVANIPYYITGEFLRKFLEHDCGPERMVLMLQKEVAKRISGEKESILSISVKTYGVPRYIDTVPARHFRPIPAVDSAVLLIEQISKDFFTLSRINEEKFFTLIKTGFAHKRKVLIKNLEVLIPKEILLQKWQELGLSLTVRAEELTLENWKHIAELLS